MGSVQAWMVWAVVAGVLAMLELATTALVFVMLAIGAAGAAAAAGLGVNPVVQVLVFCGVSVATLVFARPAAVRRLHSGPVYHSGTAALIGREALVLERVDGDDGRVRLSGEVWSARSYDGHTEFEAGARVQVVQIDGATALVL